MSTLLDDEMKDAYREDISEEYEEIREEYLDSLADRKFKTLEEVRHPLPATLLRQFSR